MRRLALLGMVLMLADEGAYALIIAGQSGATDHTQRVPLVMGVIAAAAVAAGVTVFPAAVRIRTLLLAFGAGSGLALGFLAIFSIGLPLLVAGAVLSAAALQSYAQAARPPRAQALFGGLGAVGLLVAGMLLTAAPG